MIEVNLSPVQQTQDFTKVGPINLTLINPIYLLIAIVAIYVVEPAVDGFFNDDIATLETEYKIKQNQLQKLRTELSSFDEVKKQVEELNQKEKELEKQVDVIKQIVAKRQNPYAVLKYIAEKTPDDVWIVDLVVDDRNLKIMGYSRAFPSITKFIEELRLSIHFNSDNINYTKPQTLNAEFKGIAVEPFEITAQIVNFYGD
ncbi:MAG: PilN domain-containing protein [Bdellovibrionota bacterium]|nr:PilN domain-containing protein [Bdellovibrionota bacterium]